jgi:hypothetical protein
MKVKLQSDSKLQLAKAVKEVLNLCLRKAKDLIDEQGMKENNGFYVIIDSEKTEEQIKAMIGGCEVTCTPLSDIDLCKTTCNRNAEKRLQEVTDEDLGVSIHSIDEMSIGWQCKMLFAHEQATRVLEGLTWFYTFHALAGLHDAKFNITETHVMYKGDKATMLVITETFPTGTRKNDLEKFECLIREFIGNTCEIVNLEERIESAKEAAIEAFEDIRNYE